MGVANSREYRDLLEALRRNERGYAKLCLEYSNLSDKDCLKLSNALAINVKVKQLSLGACAISVASLQHLSRPLCSGHCRIKKLDLVCYCLFIDILLCISMLLILLFVIIAYTHRSEYTVQPASGESPQG